MNFEPDWVAPPGNTIARMLTLKEIEDSDLADELGMNDREFSQFLTGELRITPSVAVVLADCLGSTPAFWIKRDQAYVAEIKRLRQEDSSELESWAKSFPLADMRKLGMLAKGLRGDAVCRNLLQFFNCGSYSEWKAQYASGLSLVSFRSSSAFEACDLATLAWKRLGERQAAGLQLPPFDRDGLENILPDLKKLSFLRSPRKLMPKLRERLAGVGVALTSSKAVSGCRASGATWLMAGGNPIVHLSFRHLSDDHLWFTIYHEAAHILLGHVEHVGYDRGSSDVRDRHERDADTRAEELLVPREVWKSLTAQVITPHSIMSAARKAKVSPGIIVGQLENAGFLAHGRMSFMKHRFAWGDDFITPYER